MRHVRLGRTGLPVSRLCLGTMTFGLQCDAPHPWDRGLSRKHILDAIDASLRRLVDIDVLACPQCGGRLRLIATVEDPDATRAILGALATSRERPDRAPPYAPVPDISHAAATGA